MLIKTLKTLPYVVLVPIAILLALAPFNPQPHLVEKVRLLSSGQLTRPVDIFDLMLHAAPFALLLAKILLTGRHHDRTARKSGL